MNCKMMMPIQLRFVGCAKGSFTLPVRRELACNLKHRFLNPRRPPVAEFKAKSDRAE
jgi:hypothetical protein